MTRDEWLQAYGHLHRTNGYSFAPWAIYEQFLKVVGRPGPVLELACGNGLLLRFLHDLSGHDLQPFGVDVSDSAIREARAVVFPDRTDCFVRGDLRDGIPFPGPFATLMANPLYADRGYYEQVDGKIRRLHLDGSVGAFVRGCWQTVAPGGRLVLWCYDGHVAEIAPQLDGYRAALAATGIEFREVESGPVTFWLADRPADDRPARPATPAARGVVMSAASPPPEPTAGARPRRAYRPRRRETPPGQPAAGPDLPAADAAVLARCDGRRSLEDIAREVGPAGDGSPAAVRAAVGRLFRLGLLETIEQSALRGVLEFHGPRVADLRIADVCTADYFTAVRLADGTQAVAINFHNVPGPHRASFHHDHYDSLLRRVMKDDPLLLDAFLRQPALDCLGQSVRVAVLNALSRPLLDPGRARAAHGLDLRDGHLDLDPFLRPGDSVAMIGCTGNYSCPAVGRRADLAAVYFSDFEYVGPFKAGVVDCVNRFFVRPERVVLSGGEDNEAICGRADVVVIIADTLCTGTLDELLVWSAGAREVLVTGRSYAMDPVHLFDRGASGITTQRVVHPDYLGFVRDKVRRGEFGFTDPVVACFQRMYAVRP